MDATPRFLVEADTPRERKGNDMLKKRSLEDIEKEIVEAGYEAFFYIGQRLLEIRRERKYEEAGYKSWSSYCAAGRIEFKKSMADYYIRASDLRPKLPKLANTLANDSEGGWSIRQMLELAKCDTDNDAKRVAKNVISHAKKTGEKVTAKLIAQFRDGETTKAEKALEEASLEVHLEMLATLLLNWRLSLEQVDVEQWDDVPKAVVTRVITEGNALLVFLRS